MSAQQTKEEPNVDIVNFPVAKSHIVENLTTQLTSKPIETEAIPPTIKPIIELPQSSSGEKNFVLEEKNTLTQESPILLDASTDFSQEIVVPEKFHDKVQIQFTDSKISLDNLKQASAKAVNITKYSDLRPNVEEIAQSTTQDEYLGAQCPPCRFKRTGGSFSRALSPRGLYLYSI